MHFEADSGLLKFSPSDLTNYLESEFASWMDRWHHERSRPGGNGRHSKCPDRPFGIECAVDEKSAELEMLSAEGQRHEAAYVALLKQQGSRVVEFSPKAGSLADTLTAMQGGCDFVYQGSLAHDQWGGIPDFLAKRNGDSKFGDYHYEVWDTKLARSPKPYYIIQLCAYCEMLEQIQGHLPEEFHVVLGTNERVSFRTSQYFRYYRSLKESFLEFHEQFDPEQPPHPGLSREFGRWSTVAEKILTETDHLSGVANIMRSQIRKLESAGISTLKGLAQTKANSVRKLAKATFERLKVQARVQLKSRGCEQPHHEPLPPDPNTPRRGLALLPPSSALDVFFDLEGFPLVDGGLEYLFGAIVVNRGKPEFHDWWAHDSAQECVAFEDCVDWLHDRWQTNPKMHIYHYAAYEVTALRRLMGKYGTRENKVDELLRNHVFVDLYTVIKQGLIVGTPSYSLKDIERLYMGPRTNEVLSAGESMVEYYRWRNSGESEDCRDPKILKKIRDYNEEDCISTWKLACWLRDVQSQSGIAYVPPVLPTSIGAEEEAEDG